LGRTSTGDDPNTGWPSTSTDNDDVEKVRAVIHENYQLTVREVSDEVSISKSSCHTILTEKLEMNHVAAKFVPCLLTDEQKANHENFLKNVITGDETWVYGYDIKAKAQLSQWMGKSPPQPKKAHQSRSNVKVLLIVFFYGKGVVHHEFVPRGQTVLLGGHEAFE
jgi:hypothetical protein